jgi:polar amino acid transport system substrate-binding protein
VFERLQVLPWPRAYKRLENEPGTVLFAMTRTAQREKLIKWVGPISTARNVLVARKDRQIRLSNLGEAAAWRIGVIQDDAFEQLLWSAGIPAERLGQALDLNANLLKLQSGHIDLFAYDENVCRWQMRSLGMNPAKYETVWVVQAFQRALDELKETGAYHRIMDAYLH